MAGFDECCCGRTDHLTDGGGSKKPVPKTMPARTQTCARRRYYGNKNLLGQFTPYQRARARSTRGSKVRCSPYAPARTGDERKPSTRSRQTTMSIVFTAGREMIWPITEREV